MSHEPAIMVNINAAKSRLEYIERLAKRRTYHDMGTRAVLIAPLDEIRPSRSHGKAGFPGETKSIEALKIRGEQQFYVLLITGRPSLSGSGGGGAGARAGSGLGFFAAGQGHIGRLPMIEPELDNLDNLCN